MSRWNELPISQQQLLEQLAKLKTTISNDGV